MTTVARRVVLNSSLVEEIEDNQIKAQGGANMMWLNGHVVQESDLDPLRCVVTSISMHFGRLNIEFCCLNKVTPSSPEGKRNRRLSDIFRVVTWPSRGSTNSQIHLSVTTRWSGRPRRHI